MKKWIAPILLLFAFYFISRLVAIRAIPPFNDELIYVRWAQEGYFDSAKRLISLGDGKQPLYIWLTSLMMNIISSPLAAGRIVSVLAGFTAMIGLGVLSYQLFKNRWVSIVSSLLYVVFPEALLLDRFALYDTLLASLVIWSIIVLLHLIQYPTLGFAFVLAFAVGAALLVKSSAIFLFVLLPLAILFFAKIKQKLILTIFYLFIAILVALLYQSVLYLSPDMGTIAEKNMTYVYSWNQLSVAFVVEQLVHNLSLYSGWVVSYASWPILVVATVVGFIDRKNCRQYLFLILAFSIPFLAIVVMGKTVYPRHLYFSIMPLLILAGAGVVKFWHILRQRWVRLSLILICFFPIVYTSARILIDYKTASLPALDRFQYIDGWPAGWGIKDIKQYLEQESAKGPITVFTEGLFGSMSTTAMQLYFGNYPQVHIVPIDDKDLIIPAHDSMYPAFVILNKVQKAPKEWNAEEVLKIQKGIGDSYIRLLKIK